MTMKRLFRHTSTLILRTALLLGAMILVNIQHTQAQTAAQWAELPDAFETMDPASIIGDGNYYYIQFYDHTYNICSYLTDCGVNQRARAMDFLPYVNNRLWTLVDADDDNEKHFKLKSKSGRYLQYKNFGTDTSPVYRFASVEGFDNGTTLTFHELDDGYDISEASDEANPMYRPSNAEWTELAKIKKYSNSQSYNLHLFRLRFAKLKSTAAFIIYYRGEAEGAAGNNLAANAETTRHYLTYSGTGETSLGDLWWSSDVSSRQSIIPKDKPLCTLPTVASYHKDGLWTLEKADVEGQFYIKKYGTSQYLNERNHDNSGIYDCELSGKDATKGIYTLESPDVNRYTRVQNVKFTEEDLTDSKFNNTVDFNIETSLGSGAVVAGTGSVDYQTYADLSDYQKMTINGTSGMQLRVLMNRQEDGSYAEKDVTIGDDGKAVVDLTDLEINHKFGQATVKMTYINGSDGSPRTGTGATGNIDNAVNDSYGEVTTAVAGYNTVNNGEVGLGEKGWNVNKIIYLKVDASEIPGHILKATLKAKASGSTDDGKRNTIWGVGHNQSEWKDNLTWNTADRTITDLTPNSQTRVDVDKSATEQPISFDITDAFYDDESDDYVVTLLVYELAAGGGNFKDPVVEVEYEPYDMEKFAYAHLNSLKVNWGSSGTINSIKLAKVSDQNVRYLHHADGDGWQVLQWSDEATANNKWWYAGFYPVEVPEPNEDKYFRVLAGFNDNYGADGKMLTQDGWLADYDDTEGHRQLLHLYQGDDYRTFYFKTPSGLYIKPTGGTTSNSSEAEFLSNTKLCAKFNLKWYFVSADKEIPVGHWVRHKMSYLKTYVDNEDLDQRDLAEQGLATNEDSQWKNFDGNLDGMTQNVNHYVITHYVRKGDTRAVLFPTVLRTNNDHVFFQRFYNYKETDENMDLDNLKAHISLDGMGDGNAQYYLYKNGMVTGEKLDWTGIDAGDMKRLVVNQFKFTNSDGKDFTVAADVSRYSDLEYKNPSAPLDDDLIEPSLTMRYIYKMRDAKSIAKDLTACTEGSGNWYEYKKIHFPARRLPYENEKLEGYRGEFLSLYHLFRDYWVFKDPQFVKQIQDPDDPAKTINVIDEYYISSNYLYTDLNDFLDDCLVHAVTSSNSNGRIQIALENNTAGITLGGHVDGGVAKGFYLYDEAYNGSSNYADSRFMVFNYPSSGVVTAGTSADLCAYFVFVDEENNHEYKYLLCKYTIIFDEPDISNAEGKIGNQTLPWGKVKGTARDPKMLREKAGDPIAKITFDYPLKSGYYHTPSTGYTKHNNNPTYASGTQIDNSSPIPLPFAKTNYAFDGENCSWGSYALISQSETPYGYNNVVLPANTSVTASNNSDKVGYDIAPDGGMSNGFLYIDASEQPGDICSISFQGDFCSSDKLICSGWISGANKESVPEGEEKRCPGGITLTMKGENDDGSTVSIYRFCPGQCYEVTSSYEYTYTNKNGETVTKNTVDWQQFYFEFSTDKKYKRYWMEVNNNCVSSNGGDFMLDNIEIFAQVPEVIPGVNTPLCVSTDANGNMVTDMRLLKLSVDYNKLKSSANVTSGTAELGFVFLEKEMFLKTFREGLQGLNSDEKHTLHLDGFDFSTISLDALAKAIEEGELSEVKEVSEVVEGHEGYDAYLAHKKAFEAYQTAFDAAILGNKTTWHSKPESRTQNMNSSVLYFEWDSDWAAMPEYSFGDAVNRTSPVYREEVDGEKYVVMNGNYPALNWKTNTDYYIIITNESFEEGKPFTVFNICSECTRSSVFQIEPPYDILGLEQSEDTNDYVVCEGQIPTLLTDLKGYDLDGNEVPMQDLNYDWWLGDPDHGVYATLANYHSQEKNGVRLDKALPTLRIYYPDVTDLDGIIGPLQISPNPALTEDMVSYLKELVEAGQLVLHQKSISVPAKPAGTEDPYFYMVACPIHDEMFDQALNPHKVTVVKNGSMEGFDVSSFFVGDPSTSNKFPATITMGVGKDDSRGISITSSDNPATTSDDDYDTQFFIRSNQVLPVGTKFHLEFDYKADAAATVATQAHSEPGKYNHWACISDDANNDGVHLNFTTEWQHFNKDITVTNEMGNGISGDKDDSFQTIAFNLWKGSPNTYYFDNVDFYVYSDNQYVAYFCDEPQGLRIKVGEKAPTLKTGFVPNENGFSAYNYPTDSDPVLSIRLAKKAQFMEVQHGTVVEAPVAPTDENGPSAAEDDQLHYLWLPIRDALTQTASGVIRKADDYNIYLASTNDPTWDKDIYTSMKKGSLPVVGKIVQLTAINTSGSIDDNAQNSSNRLCVYFTENFEVREGYNYTLSLPFQEDDNSNACDGTILINLKIVPDYEVWTGATGNNDWNNDDNWRRADGNTESSTDLNGDELYVGAAASTSPLSGYKTNEWNYRTPKDRILRKGFAPLYCTHILIKSDEWGKAPNLYDAIDGENGNESLLKSPFPNLRDVDGWDGTVDDEVEGTTATKATATPILRYDMQARLYDIWPDTYGEGVYPNKGRAGDLIAEMYQINSCDEIAFQPGAELLNAHLLNYNNAWVEYQLDMKRWYLLGSPLQGTISGEWYAPTGDAQQKTTYYDNVTFGEGYDRYSPAIYQRSWDKAKAVLYEVGSEYSTSDDDEGPNADFGSASQGRWPDNATNNATWQAPDGGADDYLDRLGYKPFDAKKANVAIKGIWSNTYNDAQVDYGTGGFSVMVLNHLKPSGNGNDNSAIIRLPKEDSMYDYYSISQDGSDDGGTDTQLSAVQGKDRAKNRGRLKTDLLLPASTVKTEASTSKYRSNYGERTYTRIPIKEADLKTMNGTFVEQDAEHPATAGFFPETVPAGISDLGFYLVENPFACGLDMDQFFVANEGLQKKYWLLTETGQHLVQKAANEWISPSGSDFATANAVVAPGQGFFVEAVAPATPLAEPVKSITVTFNREMQAQSRYGVESGTPRTFPVVVGQNQKMEDLLDEYGDPVYIDVDYNQNGIYGETLDPPITVNGESKTIEKEVVRVPVFEKDGNGDYVLDSEGNKIPVLDDPITQDVTIYNYVQTTDNNYKYPLKARTRGEEANLAGLVITAERGGMQSSALVMQHEGASNDFLPEEDTEAFITSDFESTPTVYTLCGRLATTINSIHDFRSLPIGVESTSDAPCTLTFRGVEALGDSIAFYDAVEQKLMPLESGTKVVVSGQTQNRYYLVRSLNQKEAAEETHLQIFAKGLTASVIASTAEPITSVRCYDTAGRLIHSANPEIAEYSFSLPRAGIYIIEAETENDHKTKKVMTK